MPNTEETLKAIKAALTVPRIGTYEAATGTTRSDDPSAIALYAWNAAISAALLAPLHICEVVVRNAVSEAIESLYGPLWPWSQGFQRSLPNPHGPVYKPQRDLLNQSRKFTTAGKIIPELKFVFWQQMFDSRHEARLWSTQLHRVLPHLDRTKPIGILRQELHDRLEAIRQLRNRIAHHEPIFKRNLADEFQSTVQLVHYRSPIVASWMLSNQHASAVLNGTRSFLGGSLWTPSHDEIACQAYRFWLADGRPQELAEAHWVRAKEFLRGHRWWDF